MPWLFVTREVRDRFCLMAPLYGQCFFEGRLLFPFALQKNSQTGKDLAISSI